MKKWFITTIIIIVLLILFPVAWYYFDLNWPWSDLGEDDLNNNDSGEFVSYSENCNNLVNNSIPLKDKQTFFDTNYTAVTLTSRDAWDQEKLPAQVTELESQDYICYPMPYDFSEYSEPAGINAELEVTKVQWDCELEYNDYKYLESSETTTREDLVTNGYSCKEQECEENDGTESSIWLCAK
ncbi:MAG: hypothetical protein ABIE68_04975 [bacterium]